ncbi:MAG TPA: translocation/assembly module TamB domain-containing protein, partial [Gammaproteobacteria bacterium]
GWDGMRWDGRIERADWRLPELGAWQLHKPVALRLGQTQGALERSCWRQTPAQLCAQFDYDARARRVRAELTDASLAQLPHGLPDTVRIDGGALAAQVDARLPVEGTAQADAQIQLSAGTLSWQQGDQRQQAAFGGATAQVRLDEHGGRAELRADMSGTDQLSMQIAAPGYALGKAAAQQPLEGRMRGEVRDFSLANGLVESIDELSGVLRLDTVLTGTLAAPQLRGELQLTDGRMFIGPAGVQLQDWEMTLSEAAADGALRLRGSARSGPGRIRFEGRIMGPRAADIGPSFGKDIEKAIETDAAKGGLRADLHVSGTDFEAVNLPEARVLASPDLRFTLRGRTATIAGKVHIPEARIEPRDLSGAVTPSRDVVRVDAPAPTAATGWTVNSRVLLSLGERVMFKGFGLRGRLAGELDIVDEAGKQPRASGELAIHEGVYSAYAQELKIERGRALYRDSPLDNPGLDVRATRKSGDVLAGVRVLGTVQVPRAELYSQPPLPQADVLSYLLLGRPVAGASGGEGELLFKAASSLGLKGGNQLAQSIGRRFGIDEVAVAGTELEGAALTLGKYLSPRLYLNYSIGLLDAANRLQLRYQLTKHLSVQTETGAAAGGDVVYTIER